MSSKSKSTYKQKVEKDKKKVAGVFRFHEVPGGTMSFVARTYKGEPIQRYTLIDGQRYELPLGIVKHLNQNGWYPVHSYKLNETGRPDVHVGKKQHRFSFESTQFIDITDEDDLATMGSSSIEEVVIMDQKSIR